MSHENEVIKNKKGANFWDILKKISAKNNERTINYFIFDSDINKNLEIISCILCNFSKKTAVIKDYNGSNYIIEEENHIIIETTNIKDISPVVFSSIGKIYFQTSINEIITLQEIVDFECNKLSKIFDNQKYFQQKKFTDFVFKKFIKSTVNSNLFSDFTQKKKFIIHFFVFLSNLMKIYFEWERKRNFSENLNIIEKIEFICTIAFFEIIEIHIENICSRGNLINHENYMRNMMINFTKLFPFNTLLKKCFSNIRDNNFTDFYFDYENMQYVNYENGYIVGKILPNLVENNFIWVSKPFFKMKKIISFLNDYEKYQSVFLFGEKGSGKTFLFQSLKNDFKDSVIWKEEINNNQIKSKIK